MAIQIENVLAYVERPNGAEFAFERLGKAQISEWGDGNSSDFFLSEVIKSRLNDYL